MKFKPIILDESTDPETLKAKHELWRMGDLSWKLKGVQMTMYNDIIDQTKDVTVNLASRRIGKSFTNLIPSVEVCIQHKLAIVKYACPTQKMVKEIILPTLRVIFDDAPPEFSLDKLWMAAENKLVFPNGSAITIAGTDNGNAEALRGAYAHLIIADEAGFMSDLSYVIDSILLPQTDTTGGKLVMSSTPNYYNPAHEFHTEYVFPREATGDVNKFTIFDSPMLTEFDIKKIIGRYKNGVENPKFKCEYMVEIPRSTELTVVPEFYKNKKNIVTDEMKLPMFVDTYTAGDIGVKDLTVFLFGYYDFKEATLCILDEWVMNGMEMTTTMIAEAIKMKEEKHYKNESGLIHYPYRRVMDNDLKLITDLNKLHNIQFLATKKTNKASAVNEMRVMFEEDRIRIHPRCKHLIYHLEHAQWKKNGKEFEHLPDSIDGEIKGGHVDACFVPGTRVLTKNGYTNIEDITPGTEVLTHKGRFKKVKHNMSRDYKGEIFDVKIKGKFKSIKSTTNHEYFVTDFKRTSNTSLKLTGQLIPKVSEFRPLTENIKSYKLYEPYIQSEKEIELSNEMCFLYGYWVAEGYLGGNGSQVGFSGNKRETNVLTILEKAIFEHFPSIAGTSKRSLKRHKKGTHKPLSCKFSMSIEGNSRRLLIGKKVLWESLRPLGKSDYKKFPDLLNKLNSEQSLYMLSGYLFGDGCFIDLIRWNSISPFIMDGIEVLMKKIGLNPSNHTPKKAGVEYFGERKCNTKVKYGGYLTLAQSHLLLDMILSKKDLSFVFEQKTLNLKKSLQRDNYSNEYVSIAKLEKEKYNGKVYNLEVEEDQSYCVEGIAVHNCDALTYMVRNISFNHNPYPEASNTLGENQHQTLTVNRESNVSSFMKRLVGIKGK